MLVLTLVLRLGVLDGYVGNGIPRVVDADEQEHNPGIRCAGLYITYPSNINFWYAVWVDASACSNSGIRSEFSGYTKPGLDTEMSEQQQPAGTSRRGWLLYGVSSQAPVPWPGWQTSIQQ
jgi:hypothetical protein